MNDRLTETQMLKLVEAYRKNECLWNTSSCYYRNQAARGSSYLKICRDLNIPGLKAADISKKIKNLRSSYAQEIKKIEKSIRSGANSVYKPKVPWFDTVNEFLQYHVTKRPTLTHLEVKSEGLGSDSDDSQPIRSTSSVKFENNPCDVDNSQSVGSSTSKKRSFSNMFNEDSFIHLGSDDSLTVDSEQSSSTADPVHTTSNLGQQRKATKKFKKQKVKDNSGYFVTAMERVRQDTSKEEEFEIFGKHIATSLRNMPRELSAMAKVHIQQTLSHFELKALSKSFSSNVVQLPDSNFHTSNKYKKNH